MGDVAEGYFITGTDTGIGKTEISLGLMRWLKGRGWKVAGMKPVAAGCDWQEGRLVNADALRIQAESSLQLPYAQVNPVALQPAIAPHLAASEVATEIDFAALEHGCRRLQRQVDWLIVEGAGGWRVPLGDEGDMAALALQLDLPVILVVGMRLGCLNHALLTVEAIIRDGCQLTGWVANCIEPQMPRLEENIATLRQQIGAPCLAVVPYMPQPDSAEVARQFD